MMTDQPTEIRVHWGKVDWGNMAEFQTADERQAAIVAWLRRTGKPQIADAIEAGKWKGQG